MQGKADDLGGGIFKKRQNDNMDRSIIAAKGGKNWFFVFLFSKKDRVNIDRAEVSGFKRLADEFALLSPSAIAGPLNLKEFVEICHGEF